MRPMLHLVAGARPNFMKIAPIVRALRAHGGLDFRLVHTGQHHDREMNDVFFEELGIPEPDVRLGCGGGTHAQQTAKIMVAYEARGMEDFVVIGHPKALTPYSLERLDAFLAQGREVVGYAEYRNWTPAVAGVTGTDAAVTPMQEAA